MYYITAHSRQTIDIVAGIGARPALEFLKKLGALVSLLLYRLL